LSSRLHSSKAGGANPYWAAIQSSGRIYFGIQWSGGWEATLKVGRSLRFDVRLPGAETQLVLKPNERIEGPTLIVVPVAAQIEAEARDFYLRQRTSLAARLFGGPAPRHMFSYNHSFFIGFGLDQAFLERQIEASRAYNFDAFVIDAGWYDTVGNWSPSVSKFAPGRFEAALRQMADRGIVPGIWTCPQYVTAAQGMAQPEVDSPGYYERRLYSRICG
jgi:alpha-galactosidase